MLAPFSEMWSGTLGKVRDTEHRVTLADGVKHFQVNPVKQGSEQDTPSRNLLTACLTPESLFRPS